MEIQNIRLDLVSPSPLNPRKTFDQVAIEELATNIEKQGLLQPITVRVSTTEEVTDLETGEVVSIPCSYEIICGERRYHATSILRTKEDNENIAKMKAHRKKSEMFQTISCIVREMTDDEAFDAMITENLQRKDVDPIEEAFAFSQLIGKGRTLEDIALRFGKSTRFVFDRVKLNSLIPELKERIRDGEIPLSGAMILSKLEEIKQIKFNKENVGQCNTARIRQFVNLDFMNLDTMPWIKEKDDKWDNAEFRPCAECECNTSNHGCLFYEMNSDCAKCTNRSCFNNKQIAYVLRKIVAEGGDLVKTGEPLKLGKSIVIDNGAESYWNESDKATYNRLLGAIKQMEYEVVNPNDIFKSRCWYSEDDDRTLKMLADGEVYRCISFFNYRSPDFDVKYFYVREGVASGTSAVADLKLIEIEKVEFQLTRAKEIVVEKGAETMREWAQKKTYYERSREFSVSEQTVFDVVVLSSCNSDYLKKLGLDKYQKESDFVSYVQNNQADRNQWYRAFISECLSSNNVNFYQYLQRCQHLIFSEQYPDDYLELGKKLSSSFEKKQKKLKEQLRILSVDNTEEA